METELADGGNQVEEAGADPEPAEVADPSAPDGEPGSPADLSIDEVDRLLDEVEGALSRLDDGTYGTCAVCGEPIDDAFLAASPTTRTCPDCTSTPAD
jgi:DnaK suppressor protein